MTAARAKPRKAATIRTRPVRQASTSVRPWVLLALAAVTLVAYSNSFSSPFLLDDQSSIVDNATIRRLWPLGDVFRIPKQFPTSGRPVVNLSLAINYAIGGLSPEGYHAWNLVVHILCGLSLFGIVRRTLSSNLSNLSNLSNPSNLLAFASALIWLVHPLQSEVIDYVTERTESMMALCYLLTLYCAIRGFSSDADRAWWFALSAIACSIGMACKESMVTAPVMVLLYDRVFDTGSFRKALEKRRWLYAGLAASWIVLIVLNASGPRFRSAGFSSGIHPLTYLLNQLVLICRYLRLAIWPIGQVVDYGVPRALQFQDVWPFGLMILLLVTATAAAWWRYPKAAFLGTWFFVTLAPTSSVVPIATEVGAERRMYLPLCALVTLAVCAIFQWSSRIAEKSLRTRQMSQTLAVALAAVSSILIVLTVRRNSEYQASREVLWQTVLDRYPNARAHYNLGVILREQGKHQEAAREFNTAAPELPDAEYALGFERFEEKNYAEAISYLRHYVQLRPEDANVVRAYNLLGRALASAGKTDDAIEAFRGVLQMQPRNVDALGGLADALLSQQRLDDAIVAYQDYVRVAPPNAPAYFNLGLALGRQRRDEEAVAAFTRAVAIDPRDPAFRANLASGLVATGRVAEAIEEYRRAAELERDPDLRSELTRIADQLAASQGTSPR